MGSTFLYYKKKYFIFSLKKIWYLHLQSIFVKYYTHLCIIEYGC